jgi:uracil-DNA glycosylase
MFGDGFGWVPDQLVNSPLTILAQNPGADEEAGRRVVGWEQIGYRPTPIYDACTPQPLIGKTGWEMTTKFLPMTGFARDEVSLCNVLKCRLNVNGKRTNDMPTGATLKAAVAQCTANHLRIPSSTRVILAMGAHAWAFLGGAPPITDWRGFTHELSHSLGGCLVDRNPDRLVLATLHIADVDRDPRMDIPTRLDWAKIPKILAGTWPKPVPPALVVYETGHIGDMTAWLRNATTRPWLVIDTEYSGDRLTLLGIGDASHVMQVRWDRAAVSLKAACSVEMKTLVGRVPIIFQNAIADVPVLREHLGLDWPQFVQYEDTMQAHAVLYPEWPHDLGFLASLYGQHQKLKHLSQIDPLLYNQGDVLETANTWIALLREFHQDRQSYDTYRTENIRLLPHIDRCQQVGLRVNPARVVTAQTDYAHKRDVAQLVATAYAGYPMNLGSDQQVAKWVYGVEKMPVQKHKETRRPTVNKDAVAVLRGKTLPFDAQDEVNVETMFARIAQGGHPLLEARVVYSEAEQVITHYINPLVEP